MNSATAPKTLWIILHEDRYSVGFVQKAVGDLSSRKRNKINVRNIEKLDVPVPHKTSRKLQPERDAYKTKLLAKFPTQSIRNP